MFGNVFNEKKVLVTGNTGFKGSWLTCWLLKLGAKVVGISNDVPSTPSMFDILNLRNEIVYYQEDVRNFSKMKEIFLYEKPDYVFHLAAQAIVSTSYEDPILTISTNVLGTANILEVLKELKTYCTAVIITSDKCYENVEWLWGYRENDYLGGKDIYSASKASAEIIINAYVHSFFKKHNFVKIASTRAGNVIGGGDWAKDRIVVDCVRSWSNASAVVIRSPNATRPWQHVLEPLSGYLHLAHLLSLQSSLNGESFNFGPKSDQNRSVLNLISDLANYWKLSPSNAYIVQLEKKFSEAGLLKLNCDKALSLLNWSPNLDYEHVVNFVGEWYYKFYVMQYDAKKMHSLTHNQIAEFEEMAAMKQLVWTK